MYQLTVIEPNTDLLITVEEARDHLKIVTPDNGYVEGLLRGAQSYMQRERDLAVLTTRYRLATDDHEFEMRLPKPPLVSVESVKLDGLTVDSDLYTVYPGSPGYFRFKSLYPWRDCRVMTVEFTAGYETAADVPDVYKQALKLLIGHWYEQRQTTIEGSLVEVPFGYRSLMDSVSWGAA